METVGPPEWPGRNPRPLARYLARVVVGQQLSTRAAKTIWERVEGLAKAAGLKVPALALQLPAEQLRACGLSAGKTRSLQGLAEADLAGRLKRQHLGKVSHDERSAALTTLRGIGPWTADMVSLFYFGDHDIWPLGDLSVRNTLARFVDGQRKYDLAGAATLFAPRRSLLALYLWRIANALPAR